MKIRINEIFHSIQGEGVNAGLPAIFIRFQGCNLNCPWCDTSQAISAGSEQDLLSTDEIVEKVLAYNCMHVVITGGEPTHQMAGLLELISTLSKLKYTLELETNGFSPLPETAAASFQQINVGLKLPESSMALGDNYYRQAIDGYEKLANVSFKIVLGNDEHFTFFSEVLLGKYRLDRRKICLMPLGDNVDDLQDSASKVLDICKRENVRFSPRLHIVHGIR